MSYLLKRIYRFYLQPCRYFSKYTNQNIYHWNSLSEVLRQKNEYVENEKASLTEAEYFHRKYANLDSVFKAATTTRSVETDGIFVNKEVRLSEIDVCGFDYDYTLVNYTDALADFIFQETIGLLVHKWKYPQELLDVCYDPSFLIRGLHIDIKKGFIMKVDACRNIQPCTVYKGLKPVPYATVQSVYNGLYIPPAILRGDMHTNDHKMTQLMDFFDLPAAYAYCSVIEHFINAKIQYQPECIYNDVRKAVDVIHDTNLLHKTILNRPELFIKPNPYLRKFLFNLASHGKSLFLISNSSCEFINKGMNFAVGEDWKEFFDIIIVNANKPDFFRSNSQAFRAVDETGAFLSWDGVSAFKRGQLYLGGNLELLRRITNWPLHRVLYFGDHVYADLADASNKWGWVTAAIIPELERELIAAKNCDYMRTLDRLRLVEDLLIENQYSVTALGQSILADWRKERDTLRRLTKTFFNTHFGSVFRCYHNPSYFSQRLALYASMYTSSVTNLRRLPLNHTCYPPRTLLPHEPH